MLSRLLSPWHPAAYHGYRRTKDYFEGWFFKSVTRDERRACAVIPGVSLTGDPASSHAFVQFADASRGLALAFRYPLAEFQAHPSRFEVRIGRSLFRRDGIEIDLDNGANRVRGTLAFDGLVPWPIRLFSPGAMGWYALVPTMECYHGVLSFDHGIRGSLEVDGEAIDYTGGRGYIEKDWGVSFPAAWIWLQTNHFDEPGVSLFGSVAKIPWRGRFFIGFLFGLWYGGRLIRFTTYAGARVRRLDVDAERIELEVENRGYRLEIRADRREGVDLKAPVRGEMSGKVNETLRARVSAALYDRRRGNALVFSGTGRNAGLELAGDAGVLRAGLKLEG